MKIKPSVNKNVMAAVQNCREVLVSETIGLLKLIGARPGEDAVFREMLIMHQHKGWTTNKGWTTKTIVCDRISYSESSTGHGYYSVSMGGEDYVPRTSDMDMTLDSLRTVYDEVRNVAMNE